MNHLLNHERLQSYRDALRKTPGHKNRAQSAKSKITMYEAQQISNRSSRATSPVCSDSSSSRFHSPKSTPKYSSRLQGLDSRNSNEIKSPRVSNESIINKQQNNSQSKSRPNSTRLSEPASEPTDSPCKSPERFKVQSKPGSSQTPDKIVEKENISEGKTNCCSSDFFESPRVSESGSEEIEDHSRDSGIDSVAETEFLEDFHERGCDYVGDEIKLHGQSVLHDFDDWIDPWFDVTEMGRNNPGTHWTVSSAKIANSSHAVNWDSEIYYEVKKHDFECRPKKEVYMPFIAGPCQLNVSDLAISVRLESALSIWIEFQHF